jgi:hypothetical protein
MAFAALLSVAATPLAAASDDDSFGISISEADHVSVE